MRKPFYWKARGAWYVKAERGRANIRLHEDEKEAYKLWQQMVALENPGAALVPLFSLVENYLKHTRGTIGDAQFIRTGKYLTSFCQKHGQTPAKNIKPHDITTWIAANKKKWGAWSNRAAIASVKRVYSWAIAEGLIDKSPVAHVPLPPAQRRETLIDDEQHIAMIEGASHGEKHTNSRRTAVFRQVLIALRHSGARPGMVAAVTRADIAPDWSTWTMQKHKTRKKTGKPLTIYPTPCLQTLTRILATKRTSGNVFLNAEGKPWTSNAIRCRMKRLRKKLGLPAGVVAYCYRHSFATNAILRGNDLATVATLLGHTDIKMVAQVYGHLDQHADHLKAAAAQAMRRKP